MKSIKKIRILILLPAISLYIGLFAGDPLQSNPVIQPIFTQQSPPSSPQLTPSSPQLTPSSPQLTPSSPQLTPSSPQLTLLPPAAAQQSPQSPSTTPQLGGFSLQPVASLLSSAQSPQAAPPSPPQAAQDTLEKLTAEIEALKAEKSSLLKRGMAYGGLGTGLSGLYALGASTMSDNARQQMYDAPGNIMRGLYSGLGSLGTYAGQTAKAIISGAWDAGSKGLSGYVDFTNAAAYYASLLGNPLRLNILVDNMKKNYLNESVQKYAVPITIAAMIAGAVFKYRQPISEMVADFTKAIKNDPLFPAKSLWGKTQSLLIWIAGGESGANNPSLQSNNTSLQSNNTSVQSNNTSVSSID